MHVVAAQPAAPKDHQTEIADRSKIEHAALAKSQNTKPANSAQPCASPTVDDDIEDMWDNLPI